MLFPDFKNEEKVHLIEKFHEAVTELKKLHNDNENLKLKVISLREMYYNLCPYYANTVWKINQV